MNSGNAIFSPGDRLFRVAAIGLSILVWAHLWLRAAWVPVAHDEAATFFYYIQYQKFLPWKAHWDANNHILNSALSSLLFPFTGSSTLSIRLANLLFFPLFAWYLFRISLKLHSRAIRWIFFFSLLMAHNLVSFFALSRGYGMSMGLLMASVFHLMSFQSGTRNRDMVLSLVYMVLAVLANLALLNSLLILIGLLTFTVIIRKKRTGAIASGISQILFLGVLPVIFFAFLSFKMKEMGLLYYGSTESFWGITVVSLLQTLAGSSGWLVSGLMVVFFLLVLVLFMVLFFKKPGFSFLTDQQYTFFLFLTGNLLIIQLLRWTFNINYPEDRVGLHLFPFFIGSLVFLSDKALPGKWSWTAVLVLLFFPVHFIAGMNFYKAPVYKVDIIPEVFYEVVRSEHEEGEYPPTLGGYRVRHFCWSWLDYHHGGTESTVFWSDYPTTLTEFQIVESKDVFWMEEYYETVAVEPVNRRQLMKRRTPVNKKLVYQTDLDTATVGTAFRNLWEIPADSLAGHSVYIGFDLLIRSHSVPFRAWVVACVQDNEKKDLRYEFIALDWLRYSWMGENSRLRNGLILHDIPPESNRILLYVWNIEEVSYQVGEGNAVLFIIE